MKKQNENNFIHKFRLLNSQETSEEISWSCSDSSDYEDIPSGKLISNGYNRKRKRRKKRKELRNISNLDITITDTNDERKSSLINAKSPILVPKSRSKSVIQSPILTPSQACYRFTNNTAVSNSPIANDLSKNKINGLKSPIIQLKRELSKVSPRVKKKLFNTHQKPQNNNENGSASTRSSSPIISDVDSLDRRKCMLPTVEIVQKISYFNQPDHSLTNIDKNKYLNKEHSNPNLKKEWTHSEHKEITIQSTSSSDDNGANTNSRKVLIAKVKSFFDNYFSSQASQHSISECETFTPRSSSKCSDEIEIINQITQVKSLTPSSKAQTTTSFGSTTNTTKPKSVKYKKGGLAFRLNALLKKQNASISLWQHERFLAANSDFVIPKEEFLAFRIKSYNFSYSIYLLDVVNKDGEEFLVIINSQYVNNNVFESDGILKVYKPYKIIDNNSNCKIVVNVCKFECEKIKY